MKNEKNYASFRITKMWQILKHLARSFHQTSAFYFWRVNWEKWHFFAPKKAMEEGISIKVSVLLTFYSSSRGQKKQMIATGGLFSLFQSLAKLQQLRRKNIFIQHGIFFIITFSSFIMCVLLTLYDECTCLLHSAHAFMQKNCCFNFFRLSVSQQYRYVDLCTRF